MTHSDAFYDDLDFQREREIKRMGSSYLGYSQARADNEADEDARIKAHWSDTDWSDYEVRTP